MAKLTIEELRRAFQGTRTDHPGRKGSQTFTRGSGTFSKDGLSPKERRERQKP